MIPALVPAKTLAEAKGRLASTLTEVERAELVLAMLEDVVRALLSVRSIDRVCVISPDDHVLSLAAALGATPIAESAHVRGINQALNRALSAMSPHPEALLVVLGDLPEISPLEVEELLAQMPARGVAACPSADGGTSAIALRPPNVVPFSFGSDSFMSHRLEANRLGVDFAEVKLDSLRRDVDSPDNLRLLASQSRNTATHRLIARLGIAQRLGVA